MGRLEKEGMPGSQMWKTQEAQKEASPGNSVHSGHGHHLLMDNDDTHYCRVTLGTEASVRGDGCGQASRGADETAMEAQGAWDYRTRDR
jgi:hypothetical protein